LIVIQRLALIGSGLVLVLGAACATRARDGVPAACIVDPNPSTPCVGGLVGYSCTDSARPDENPDYVDGVPSGMICTDEGAVAGSGAEAFCCAPSTPCAYDPVPWGCSAPAYAYQCRGSDRPEAFDPSLFCGEGLREGSLIDYCCSPSAPTAGCSQISGKACPKSLTGWTCHDQTVPSEVELGENQSRADFNVLVCSTPTVVTDTTGTDTYQYCCFTPTSLPKGGSCLGDTVVPGCPVDSFGFACTGVDTPEQDYPGIYCSGGGTAGANPQGYAATLYCCQYQTVDGG
jgi:hypothetical protein